MQWTFEWRMYSIRFRFRFRRYIKDVFYIMENEICINSYTDTKLNSQAKCTNNIPNGNTQKCIWVVKLKPAAPIIENAKI